MPISIRSVTPDGKGNREIDWLCDGNWDLPIQVEALTEWLAKYAPGLPPDDYCADIGFCWRRNAGGGGSAISPETMKLMAEANMYLFLSEYPGFSDSDTLDEETEEK